MNPNPPLLILSPASPTAAYTQYIRQFVDVGVHFPFADDYALPRGLPSDLAGIRCVVIDPARREEFSQGPLAARLIEFERGGGHLFWPDPNTPTGGATGDLIVRHSVARIINTAGLPMGDPAMIARLQEVDDAFLVGACKGSTADELGQYVRMRHYFPEPVGMWAMPTAIEAAEFFGEPALADPVWAHIAAYYPQCDHQPDRHGTQHFLDYAEKTGDRKPLEHLVAVCRASNPWPRLWRKGDVFLNCDLHVPDGADADHPPEIVLRNAWVWPETNLWIGETYATVSRFTGEARWLDRAVAHVLEAHRWLFEPKTALYWHVGRPGGPDLRSAPWARGDSHFLWGVRSMLNLMPEEHPKRRDLCGLLGDHLEGLLRVQGADGLWLNVLDASPSDSRPCSSASSQFVRIYARAYARGWLRDERIPPMVERAWKGLKTKIWDGRFLAWCVGTSHGLNRQVYLSRPHDSMRCCRSAILSAWMEIQKMRGVTKG
ncbi:MAG: glycoside hydrolase family 88 protein [Verrucomicrobiae bacterium]|nr:glycoside hydrolase family 88 protein [Verrucomicrobiae bacterium]